MNDIVNGIELFVKKYPNINLVIAR